MRWDVHTNYRSMAMASMFVILIGIYVFTHAAKAEKEIDAYKLQREKMIQRDIEGRGVRDKAVLQALSNVPRHRFVPPREIQHAYADRPLPIGHGQTISQPYIVAAMTELLNLDKDDVVLEVGSGSGYQAAVLAEIVKQVYTIEIIPELGEHAKRLFLDLGYDNIEVKIGDGYYGWKQHAPFDAIIVTAAASHIPPSLIEQMKPGAFMAIPVGPAGLVQHLIVVEKYEDGTTRQRNMMAVRFVPLTGEH